PFPTFPHPSAEVAQAVNAALVKLHGRPRRPVKAPPSAEVTDSSAACGQVQSVVEALVRTILSQNTTNANSSKAWRAVDPDEADRWDQILFAPVEDVADAIRCGGLANNKAKSIHNMLRDVKDKYGVVSLDHLHGKSDEDAMRELVGFSGVGPKTASCVLLFCLRRESFAVDTHVYRISRALNWVPQKANREQAQAHLDVRIPEDIKHSLHCLLVTHGKSCKDCAANGRLSKPDSGPCPLIPFLRGARKGAQGEGGDVPPEPSDETGAEGMEESRADEEVVGADGEVKEEEDVKGVVDAETEDEHLKEEHGYHGL
ncbi:DNA glycosylase, partial [Fimicolochytrium jonesii]|uniref:DNA glycosylase n=1 Tax=Fimicolochytrium jonesii TaxID=1396493 RepID=UPI0022FEB6DA